MKPDTILIKPEDEERAKKIFGDDYGLNIRKSRCCGAPLIGGVQCEACGADDRTFVPFCPSCHTYKEDPLDIEQIEETGECLACDKLRGEYATQ